MKSVHSYVIGIDGGGTKTRALIADTAGRSLAEFCAGPSNMQVHGAEQSARVIAALVKKCLTRVRADDSRLAALCCGLAGVGREPDRRRMRAALKKMITLAARRPDAVIIENDARIALEGAFCGGPGIILVAGTGSITYGRDVRGGMHRAGGWGRYLDDGGSGYAIGKEALRAFTAYLDGYGMHSRLFEILADRFGLKDQCSVIRAVYTGGLDLASIAPAVLETAGNRDRLCSKIVEDAVSDLTRYAAAIYAKINKSGECRRDKMPLVFCGGLIDSDTVLSRRLRARLKRQLPQIRIVEAAESPVAGAVRMALACLK